MVASAYAAHVARRAGEYGINITGEITTDMKSVKARKDKVSGDSNHSVESSLRSAANVSVYTGQARFRSNKEVEVNGETLSATRIFINVGGRALVPDMPGVKDVPFLTNSSMMDVDFLPEHLIVIGGSYIGLEFGQMYRRFGSKVTIVERTSKLIGKEDDDVSSAIYDIIRKEDIDVELNSTCISLHKDGDGVAVGVDCENDKHQIRGSHVLLAVGRRPNTEDLGLENTNVETDKHGYINVDDQLRTSVPGIWALGDCNGKGAFTHTSYNDFEIVAANILDNDLRKVSDRIQAYALYVDPPLGRAGMTEAEVRKSGRKALVGMRPMTRVSRAIEKGETQGFMKIVVDANTKEILGAAILGVGGDEVIHSVLDLMYAKAPYTVMQRAMHIHPTVSELLPTILGELKPIESTVQAKAS
jgi:pyruvate/2-oxoglutarate dehydrogenase complex dihydrolipoamide dehydrogenase (E3) component